MSAINGLGGNLPVQKTAAPTAITSTAPASTTSTSRPADKLDLSGTNHLLQSQKSGGFRADKVASIKSQIENGTYEDDHKLDGALDGLLNDLLK